MFNRRIIIRIHHPKGSMDNAVSKIIEHSDKKRTKKKKISVAQRWQAVNLSAAIRRDSRALMRKSFPIGKNGERFKSLSGRMDLVRAKFAQGG